MGRRLKLGEAEIDQRVALAAFDERKIDWKLHAYRVDPGTARQVESDNSEAAYGCPDIPNKGEVDRALVAMEWPYRFLSLARYRLAADALMVWAVSRARKGNPKAAAIRILRTRKLRLEARLRFAQAEVDKPYNAQRRALAAEAAERANREQRAAIAAGGLSLGRQAAIKARALSTLRDNLAALPKPRRVQQSEVAEDKVYSPTRFQYWRKLGAQVVCDKLIEGRVKP
jgi:hypothetical protein